MFLETGRWFLPQIALIFADFLNRKLRFTFPISLKCFGVANCSDIGKTLEKVSEKSFSYRNIWYFCFRNFKKIGSGTTDIL